MLARFPPCLVNRKTNSPRHVWSTVPRFAVTNAVTSSFRRGRGPSRPRLKRNVASVQDCAPTPLMHDELVIRTPLLKCTRGLALLGTLLTLVSAVSSSAQLIAYESFAAIPLGSGLSGSGSNA